MKASHQRHNRQHNDEKFTSVGSLLGLPVKLSNGIAYQTKHKTTINQTYIHKGQWGIQTWLFGWSYMGNQAETAISS